MMSTTDSEQVQNQSPPFADVDLFTSDAALQDAVKREGATYAMHRLAILGAAFGSAAALDRGRLANENPPKLYAYDAKGRRRDVVEFHPAYHDCMATSMAAGLHCEAWDTGELGGERAPAANVARAGGIYMAAQMEFGHCCPIIMTNAAVPTLRLQPDLAEIWVPKILSRTYDPSFCPASEKQSVTIGMGMTEKQGGTDVRANSTRAEPVANGGPGGDYVLSGHKWFFSAPMSDAFLVLAQCAGGLSCFLVPRHLPDGTVNAIRLQRLKDKLGNRSNASAEVEFHGAHGWLIGEEGRGVPAIIEMVTYTRLDCAVASAGLMRLALANAIHHARHRGVFGKLLIDQPLMAQVLADLALDVEAATALVFRLARSFDPAEDERAAAWRRLMTPVTKYWVCKIAPAFVAEAMECLGGNGYVEENGLARIYREVPVNSIWEGSGNVMAVDVLRVVQREPQAVDLVLEELAATAEGDLHLQRAHARLQSLLQEPRLLDLRARSLLETLAVTAAGSILHSHAPHAVADGFIASRLGDSPRQTYGQAVERSHTRAILDRALPQ